MIVTILTIPIITKVSIQTDEGAMVTRKNPRKYKTKEICDLYDISRATLFRWESEGLLLGVGRDWRGWRVYDDENVKTIERIIKGKNAF
jgi:hypothetical protein